VKEEVVEEEAGSGYNGNGSAACVTRRLEPNERKVEDGGQHREIRAASSRRISKNAYTTSKSKTKYSKESPMNSFRVRERAVT